MKGKEVNFVDYFGVLIKWRRLILGNFVIVCVIAVGVSLILPKWYKAKATLLPPVEQTTGAFGLASLLSELPLGELGAPGLRSPVEVFKAILESRTVAEAIVTKLDLIKVYKKRRLEDAIRTLGDHSQIEFTDEGLISISVEERNPELAADIANAYVEELDRVNQMTSTSQAKSTRIFVEGRLKETQENLKAAEEALRLFQEEYKTVSLPDQITAVIQGAADLKARQVALEVEKGVLLKTFNRNHPQVVLLRSEIEELQKQLDQIVLGDFEEPVITGTEQRTAEGGFDIPLSEVPSMGLQVARLTREVKIQEAIFELLTQQYEQAKIQEAKDTPTVQALDVAVAPEKKSRPKRMIFVLMWGSISLVLGIIFSFLIDYWQRIKLGETDDYQSIKVMVAEVKKDVWFLKRKKKLSNQ